MWPMWCPSAGPNTINRENVNRRLVISANVDGRDLRGAVNDICVTAWILRMWSSLKGYFVSYGGQFESEAEASRTLALTVAAGACW